MKTISWKLLFTTIQEICFWKLLLRKIYFSKICFETYICEKIFFKNFWIFAFAPKARANFLDFGVESTIMVLSRYSYIMFFYLLCSKLWSRSGPEILEIPVWWPSTPRARFCLKYPETIVFGKIDACRWAPNSGG